MTALTMIDPPPVRSGRPQTGYVWHERYMWHMTGIAAGVVPAGGFVEPGLFHIDNATAKRRIHSLIEVSGLMSHLRRIEAEEAARDEVLRVHTPDYLDLLHERSVAGHGDVGEKAVVGPDSLQIALLAAGGCIRAADAIMSGEAHNAYALVRPAGHHAEPERGRGFCLLSNGCITVEHLRATSGVGRIAIVDWDAHHGNGAQKFYYGEDQILTISIHEASNYPLDSGAIEEVGEGRGIGANINIPMPPGSGHDAYIQAARDVIVPALMRFRPEFILVSSGFDGSLYDPLARQMAMSETYRQLTRAVMGCAEATCSGRLLMIHEGGYSEFYTPFCGIAVIEELAGVKTAVEDPFVSHLLKPVQRLQPHQADVVRQAAALIKNVPTPKNKDANDATSN